MFALTGKTVLITGGAQGIGYGIADAMGEAGAQVFICDLNAEKGEAAAAALRATERNVEFYPADVTSPDQVAAFVHFAAERTGRIDVLCSNASWTTGAQHDIVGATEDEWEQNFRVGMMGTQYATQSALPWMIRQESGSIIVISSIQALAGCPASTAYTSIKAAQLGFVKSAAFDYGQHNIRANAICPGPIQVGYSPKPGTPGYEYQVRNTMLRRVGQPREIGCAAVFLASDESSFITGAVLPVDGGWTAM